jgi:hypothetical protein
MILAARLLGLYGMRAVLLIALYSLKLLALLAPVVLFYFLIRRCRPMNAFYNRTVDATYYLILFAAVVAVVLFVGLVVTAACLSVGVRP